MKDFVKQLISPLLPRSLKPAAAPAPPIFNSYGDAYVVCQKSAYEGEDIVKVVIEKNIAYKKQIQSNPTFDLGSLRTLIGLGIANTKDSLHVLDFGGGGGYHYTIARVALGNGKSLKWNVIETPAMVKEAQRITDGNLKFFDNITDAKSDLGSVDLVFTSSALQYCPNPLKCLKELTEVGAKYLFITRTPFGDSDKSLISIQESNLSDNGPGPLPLGFADRTVSYPITFANKHEAEEILNEKYEIRFSIVEDKGSFRAGNSKFDKFGYFCSLR